MLDVVEVLEGFDAKAYLDALVAVAKADGVKPEEREFIVQQAASLGIEPDFEHPIDLTILRSASSIVTRRIIIRDCIVLAAVDGDYSANERERIGEIASGLGVDARTVERIEDWIKRYSDILEEGQRIFAGSDG